jgi:hypothetical protein
VDLDAANEQDRGQADGMHDHTPNLLSTQNFLAIMWWRKRCGVVYIFVGSM